MPAAAHREEILQIIEERGRGVDSHHCRLQFRQISFDQRCPDLRDHLPPIPSFQAWTQFLRAWLEDRPKNMLALLSTLGALKIQEDPEAMFVQGWMLCAAGEHAAGLAYLERAVAKGYYASPTLTGARQFDGLRRNADFQALVVQAETGRRQALAVFREAGGERLLGR